MKKIIFILLVLTGCNRLNINNMPTIDSNIDSATVMFYFLDDEECLGWSRCTSHGIVANDVYVTKELTISDHIIVNLKADSYKIHSDSVIFVDRISNFKLEANNVYYIKMWYDYGFWVSSIRFTMTDRPDKL